MHPWQLAELIDELDERLRRRLADIHDVHLLKVRLRAWPPTASPIPATTHTLAAVVRPRVIE